MMGGYAELSGLLARVARRWRTTTALRAWARAAAASALVLAAAWAVDRFAQPSGGALIVLWAAAVVLSGALCGRAVRSMRRQPSDLQIARFVEERCPELEDSLVTAVGSRAPDLQPMAAAVTDDAVRRTRLIDIDRVIGRDVLRRTVLLAAGASLALGGAALVSAPPAGQAARLLSLYLLPSRLSVDVLPGDARVRAGASVRVVATLSSGDAIVPVLRVGDGDQWRETRMEKGPDGFAVLIAGVEGTFRYVVTAAGASSREYTVTVLHPPRVDRIDLHYEYPTSLGMPPRSEEDGGDIYGPAGTRVRVTVHPDKPVRDATLNLAGGGSVALASRDGLLEGELTIAADDSYRVLLADADGLTSTGGTEYFIRTLQDRPPDVRIIRPASDRQATPLEEVPIEARAEDDFGVASLDLVYSIAGGPEQAVPFTRSGGAGTAVTGRRTVYLEDLRVRPGDVVAYYARARDVSRGRQSSEARSDIFFLEVTPFEEEFVASESQGGGGGGGGSEQGLEDLIQAQKEVVTATWNLDRRARQSGGRSAEDVRTVAKGQYDLRTQASALLRGMQRATDIRRRRPAAPPAAAAGPDPTVEAINRAISAMGSAYEQLERLQTAAALPHEMTALNELMRAQGEVRRREIAQQASGGGGGGSNRRQQDMSSLFDRELAKQQQTNYETPSGRETREEAQSSDDALEKVRELAERQEALAEGQRELARNRDAASQDEQRREIERLTREQSDLRQEAEALAQEIERLSQQQEQQGGGRGGQGAQGQGAQGGRGAQSAAGSQSGERQQASRAVQQAAEEMQSAANELRRENPEQASASGSRAAERLRDAEQQVRGAQPDERRRAIGELQLESRQLADAERQLGGGAGGADPADRARQRASEQERLADRAERLEDAVRQLAGGGRQEEGDQRERSALEQAAQEVERQRLSERMREAARSERQAAGGPGGQAGPRGAGDGPSPPPADAQMQRERQEIARGLDSLADRLGAAASDGGASQELSEELTRLRRQREELAALDRQLSELREQGEDPKGQSGSGEGQPGQSGQNSGGSGAWAAASDLLEEMRRESPGDVPETEGFNPGRSAAGTEGWKQDFAQWDQLKVQIAAALERAERSAADRLRGQQSRDRLNAGATQAVPDQYRRLVEQYYRDLASGADR